MRRIQKGVGKKQPVRMLQTGIELTSIARTSRKFGQIKVAGNKDACATCLHCPDSPCITLAAGELNPDIPLETTHYPSDDVCVYDAVSWDDAASVPVVDEDLCVGCGACLGRCPVGAIRLNESGKAEVNYEDEYIFKETEDYSEESFRQQQDYLRQLTENIVSDADIRHVLKNFPQVLAGLEATPLGSKLAYGLLVRNLLVAVGFQAKAGVPGDTNSRADLVFSYEEKKALAEIESGDAMLDAVRRLLANYAIANSRGAIPKDELEAFIVCAVFPNKRSDVYEVIENARNRIGLKIRVLPLALLTILAACGYPSESIDLEHGFELSRAKRQVAEDAFRVLGRGVIDMSIHFGAMK